MSLKITDELKKLLGDNLVKSLTEKAGETELFIGSGGEFVPKTRPNEDFLLIERISLFFD